MTESDTDSESRDVDWPTYAEMRKAIREVDD